MLGLLAAVYRGQPVDRAITGFTTLISTLPPFVVSIGLIVVLSVWLQLLPSAGYVPVRRGSGALVLAHPDAGHRAELRPRRRPRPTAAHRPGSRARAELRRRRAASAASSPARILFVHALRNGAGPAVAMLGMKIPTLIGGAVVTETIFAMPGFGCFAADSALRGDVPVVQGTLVVAIVIVLALQPGGQHRARSACSPPHAEEREHHEQPRPAFHVRRRSPRRRTARLVALLAVFGPLLAPYDPLAQNTQRPAGPSAEHLLGTDYVGATCSAGSSPARRCRS